MCIYTCIVLINFIVLDVPLCLFILFVSTVCTCGPITNDCEVNFAFHSECNCIFTSPMFMCRIVANTVKGTDFRVQHPVIGTVVLSQGGDVW